MTRWPFAPLIPHIEAAHIPHKHDTIIGYPGMLARITGRHRSVISRWQTIGIPDLDADEIAVALGVHPGEVWDDWFDQPLEPVLCPVPSRGAIKRHRRAGEPLCLDCAVVEAEYERGWRARNPELARAKQARSNARNPNRNGARDARRAAQREVA